MLLDFLTGPILIGTALNIWLFGFMCTQCFLYFVTYKDPHWMRALVIFLLVADTVNIGLNVGCVYQYLITHFGDFNYIQFGNPMFNSVPALTAIISATVQTFFGRRVWLLTEKKWFGALIATVAFIQFLCGIGTTIGCALVKEMVLFRRFRAVVTVWLVLSAATDTTITVTLIFILQRKKTGFRFTDGLINRVLRVTIQTGLLTTIAAIATLLCFLFMDNTIHLIFALPLGKLYSNSLLSTLNARAEWGSSTRSLKWKGMSSIVAKKVPSHDPVVPPHPRTKDSVSDELNLTTDTEREEYQVARQYALAAHSGKEYPSLSEKGNKHEFGEISSSDLGNSGVWDRV